MTEDPRSIGQSASVVDAARLMREEHIGSLPIIDDEKLVGMITDRDITTRVVAEAADPKTTSVGDVYSRDLISVEPDRDLEEALRLMARHQVRRLARCRERQARRHRCPGRHRPHGEREEDR
jgi:CBS domain-containing protein